MVFGLTAKELDNKILDIRTRGCELCLCENITTYEKAYADRSMTIKEIKKALEDEEQLHVTNYTWYNHIKTHLRPEVGVILAETAPVLAQEVVDKIGECVETIESLKSQADKISLSIENDPNPQVIRAWSGIVSEIRHWIELLARLQGEFKEVNKISAKNINIQYNETKEVILQEACPECKLKFAEKLAPKILNENKVNS